MQNKYYFKRLFKKYLNSRSKHECSTINQAINFDKKVIFIAIPKTGTTSIRTQLKKRGRPLIKDPHLNIRQIRQLIYLYFLKENLGVNTNFPNNDILTDDKIWQRTDEIFNSFFKFSSVRNPWARAVSLYHREEGTNKVSKRLKDRMTFEEFCEQHFYASDTCLHPTLHKNQLDWLTSDNGNLLMDYVYKLEEFDKAIVEIEKLTDGKLKLDNVKRNKNQKQNDYRQMYNDKTRKIIKKRFEKDIDFFKYTFNF